MQRTRFMLFMFLCLLTTVICHGSDTNTAKKPTRKAVVKKVFTLNFAIAQNVAEKLNQAARNKGGGSGSGGFLCTKVHVVEFHVKKGTNRVVVKPNSLKVEQGDCVQWVTKQDDDSDTPNLELVDFIDTPQEASQESKPQNKTAAGDYCSNADQSCLVYIALPAGTYTYVARVRHDNKPKKSDPELVVSCTGCGED